MKKETLKVILKCNIILSWLLMGVMTYIIFDLINFYDNVPIENYNLKMMFFGITSFMLLFILILYAVPTYLIHVTIKYKELKTELIKC